MTVFAYSRVSTADQGRSGLGLEAQRAVLEGEAVRYADADVEWVADDGISGSVPPRERPGLSQVLTRLRPGDVLIAARLDRLGRSALDILHLADTARTEGWRLVLPDLGLDTGTPVGAFTLTTLAAVAQLERDLIAERTREALAAARRRGQRLGRPVQLDREVRDRIVRAREEGTTLTAIADALNADGVATATGKGRWWPAGVARVLRSAELDAAAMARTTG